MSKVSIVIPAYNCARFIRDAIRAVREQTYADREIIVVDDGSTDDTEDVLRPFADAGQIRYIRKENGGPASARNRGIRAATGEYVAFLDADDLWERTKLEKSVRMIRDGGFDWICTAMLKVTKSGERTVKRIPRDSWVLTPGTDEIRQLRNGIFFFSSVPVHTPTIVVRAGCFARAGLFDESFLIGEDTDLWLRFEEMGMRGGYLDEPLTIYRYNPGSITRNRKVDGWREHAKVALKHARILGLHRPLIRKSYARFLWQVADEYFSHGRYAVSAVYMAKSLWYDGEHAGRIAGKALKLVPPSLLPGRSGVGAKAAGPVVPAACEVRQAVHAYGNAPAFAAQGGNPAPAFETGMAAGMRAEGGGGPVPQGIGDPAGAGGSVTFHAPGAETGTTGARL